MKHYYASPCPATGRWFVCAYGLDDIVAEAFEHEGRTAQENAEILAEALNAVPLVANLAGLNTGEGASLQWSPRFGGGDGIEPHFEYIQSYFGGLARSLGYE